METEPALSLRRWMHGERDRKLSFEEQWQLVVLGIGDRITDGVDEVGNRVTRRRRGPYYYDLRQVAADDQIQVTLSDVRKIAAHLQENGWARLQKGSRIKVSLTETGWEKAHEINDAIFNSDPSERDTWSLDRKEEKADGRHGLRNKAMEKAQFVQSAPAYYATAIALAVRDRGTGTPSSIREKFTGNQNEYYYSYLEKEVLFDRGLENCGKARPSQDHTRPIRSGNYSESERVLGRLG